LGAIAFACYLFAIPRAFSESKSDGAMKNVKKTASDTFPKSGFFIQTTFNLLQSVATVSLIKNKTLDLEKIWNKSKCFCLN
jgi:hypothetical protein